MRMWRNVVALLVWCLSPGQLLEAQSAACEQLNGGQRRVAEQLMASEYLYECCDDTIAACLEATPTCCLARRLADEICRRVRNGETAEQIRRGLSRRARSMVGGLEPVEIALEGAPSVGPSDAPVTLVVYACPRCPFCRELIPPLYREVQDGGLKGQVRLVFRTFPIRGHEGSTEAGLACVAAARLGAFWPFLIHTYENYDHFNPAVLEDWAVTVGLQLGDFRAAAADPETRAELVASKKEGLVNGVKETPTLFINGRIWLGDLSLEGVVDAVAEEADRVRGRQWCSDED